MLLGVCVQCGHPEIAEDNTILCERCFRLRRTSRLRNYAKKAKVHAIGPKFCGNRRAKRFDAWRGAITCERCLYRMGEEL
jgi:hypothetical protein